MTAVGHAALRQLAANALTLRATRAGGVAKGDALTAAAQRAFDDLARVSVPLIGQIGFDTLTGRAVHLVQREYAWLIPTREARQSAAPLAHVLSCLERQEPAVAIEAAEAVFATFAGLLVTFIGEPVTTGLLRKAWPDAFSDTITKET